MMTSYLSQQSAWKQRTGSDGYGQPVYAAEATIPCRWEQKRSLTRDAQGNEVVSEARVYVTAAVAVNDQLIDPDGRAWTVITVWVRRGLAGTEEFREVSV